MNTMYNVSSSPHVRSRLTTRGVMYDVCLALMPATVFGIWQYGFHAFLVILTSIITAVLSEFIFDKIVKKGNTWMDGSAVVTGLLLALALPPGVPLYIPAFGAVFAIVVVKGLFGGLGKNFMNPALAARCFLMISFSSTMTKFTLDGVTTATPLSLIASGEEVPAMSIFMGFGGGVIGSSSLGLLLGGLFLLAIGGISWEIPVSLSAVFVLFMGIFGGHGFDLHFLMAHLVAGGTMMAIFFMATDPVTSPVSKEGHLLYGAIIGLLCGIFRVYGANTDSVSYAVIISNLIVPLIDMYFVPRPYAYRPDAEDIGMNGKSKNPMDQVPRSAQILCLITIIAGFALSGVFTMTKEAIEEQELQASLASYKEVLQDAETFNYPEDARAIIDEMAGAAYGEGFGRVYINDVIEGVGADGSTVGYVISVTSAEGFDGNITLSLGILEDGTTTGISFTELNETAGMGMRADEASFKDQFKDVNVSQFKLNKSGGSVADDEIDSISGASITSGAVVNAVNAALDFFRTNLQ